MKRTTYPRTSCKKEAKRSLCTQGKEQGSTEIETGNGKNAGLIVSLPSMKDFYDSERAGARHSTATAAALYTEGPRVVLGYNLPLGDMTPLALSRYFSERTNRRPRHFELYFRDNCWLSLGKWTDSAETTPRTPMSYSFILSLGCWERWVNLYVVISKKKLWKLKNRCQFIGT